MIRSELAFIPNNLSSHSLQMNNFIEEQANQDNSEPKSSHSSKKHQKQSSKNGSKNPSFIHNQSNSDHSHKIANEIEGLQSHLQEKNSVLDTPVNLFNRPIGKYEFTPQAFPSAEMMLVEAITTQLNNIQAKENKFYSTELQLKKKQTQTNKKAQIKSHYEEVKVINPMEEIETDYSDLSRDLKIYEHRYQSNLAYLSDQTKQLLSYYEFMIQEEEQKQLRKQIMMLQIHNHRTKISLRNASYSKRFNYISPIPKNNDEPLEFKSKFKVETHLVDQLQQLVQNIKDEQAIWEEQQARLTLLTKYYNIMKSKTIPNKHEDSADFKYNSKLERFTNKQDSIKNSQIIIDIPFTTNGFNITPADSFHGTNSMKQSPIFKKGLAHPKKQNSPKKKVEAEITEPYQQYNLLKYKTQISKEMILEYEVYNLGRLKRIRDENRMIKKELEFIDEHITHFDRSFAEELKQYEEKQKPKITYESFKLIEQQTPFTRSPVSQDYYGNSKGCNTINLYRPDSKEPTHLRSIPKSRPSLNKSLSQSKYTIKREPTINLSNSKKDITLSQKFLLTQNDQKSDKSDTIVSFFRDRVSSPAKQSRKNNCIYTSKKQLIPIKEVPLNSSKKKLNITSSRKSLSPRSKNLLRFNGHPQTQQSIGKKSIKSPRGLPRNKQKQSISQNPASSDYYLSLDGQTSQN